MARTKSNRETKQISININKDADELLDKLTPRNERGQFISSLIYKASIEAGTPDRDLVEVELLYLDDELEKLRERIKHVLRNRPLPVIGEEKKPDE